jgi:hypothetical protein
MRAGLDPRLELLHLEGFLDVVVRAGREAFEDVLLVVLARQQNDIDVRLGAGLPDRPADFEAVQLEARDPVVFGHEYFHEAVGTG